MVWPVNAALMALDSWAEDRPSRRASSWSTTFADALAIAEEVEEQSAVYWGTLAIGGPKLLDKQEMDTILQRFKSYGQKS